MSVTLVTDEDVVGLGFSAEIMVSDSPPDVLDNDLQCEYTFKFDNKMEIFNT